jgi:hypothetical protein
MPRVSVIIPSFNCARCWGRSRSSGARWMGADLISKFEIHLAEKALAHRCGPQALEIGRNRLHSGKMTPDHRLT